LFETNVGLLYLLACDTRERVRKLVLQTADSPTEGTRQRILDAALDLFGERGLTGATVRDIAKRAKVNVAAISYHFGGKHELYRAVAQAIAEAVTLRVRARMAPVIDAPPADPHSALEALEAVIDTIVDVIVGPPEMRRVARFIIREQMHPTAAFDHLYDALSHLHGAGCRLFATATGRDQEAADTRLLVFMIVGQAIFLRVAEAAVQRRMGIDGYDQEFLDSAKALLKQNLRAMVAAARKGKA
jgi:AcrR family transcriptional regulator